MSRSNLSTEVEFCNRKFKTPIVPANMTCVINTLQAIDLMNDGQFYIMHRFGNTLKFIDHVYNCGCVPSHNINISISVGVKDEDEKLINILANSLRKVHFITIDIAHGHHILVADMINHIKSRVWISGEPYIIAGNVSTPEAVEYLQDAGADAIKVGIGPGRACTTYLKTGFMSPMFTTVQECAAVAKVPLIADGGTKEPGDIVKALVAGATMVMVGSQFTACYDSPAKTVYKVRPSPLEVYLADDDVLTFTERIKYAWRAFRGKEIPHIIYEALDIPYFKEYYGSASQYNRGNTKNIEGTKVVLEGNNMSYLQKYTELQGHLQSAISYSGGQTLKALNRVRYRVHSK
jgi:GMP reductase